jgi:hypothetical protein
MRISAATFVLLVVASCSSAPSGGGECATTSDCASGRVCVDGRCEARADSGTTDSGAGDAGAATDAGRDAAVADAPMCMPAEMSPETMCNGADDDCNGYVDDVDVGDDGICDCLRIGVIGNPGTLASSSFQAWLAARGTAVTRFGTDAAPLTAEMLAMFDVVILDRLVRDYTAEEAATLRAFVEAGGGVMVMTGYTGGGEDYTRPNTLLAPFGVGYVGGLHNGPITDFVAHPLTAGLSSVTFLGGYLIDDMMGTGTVVARLDGGTAGLALEVGGGRVFVWGDEWIEFDSEWSTMPMITELWTNVFAWLGPRDSCLLLI